MYCKQIGVNLIHTLAPNLDWLCFVYLCVRIYIYIIIYILQVGFFRQLLAISVCLTLMSISALRNGMLSVWQNGVNYRLSFETQLKDE